MYFVYVLCIKLNLIITKLILLLLHILDEKDRDRDSDRGAKHVCREKAQKCDQCRTYVSLK